MNLKQIRIEQGYTQKQVAEVIGINRPLYVNIENGFILPTPKVAENLCNLFQTKIEKLFEKEDLCFKIKKEKCIHGQNNVYTLQKTKSRVNTYHYHVRLEKEKFPLLEKNKLKELGFNKNADFLLWAYKKLQKKSQAQKA